MATIAVYRIILISGHTKSQDISATHVTLNESDTSESIT